MLARMKKGFTVRAHKSHQAVSTLENPVIDTTQTGSDGALDHLAQFERGITLFALLFTRWMDTNGWSHPVMVNLTKSCMGGVSWLHSSQISGLRHGKLRSPGPRTFIAIERLNYYIWRYSTEKKLLPNSAGSNFYANAYAITENGRPPEIGWWVEVFCGTRVPTDIDLHQLIYTEAQAQEMSANWARQCRRLLAQKGYDLIEELSSAVRRHYPVRDAARVSKTLDVVANKDHWSAHELSNELPALVAMFEDLGDSVTEDGLLRSIKG